MEVARRSEEGEQTGLWDYLSDEIRGGRIAVLGTPWKPASNEVTTAAQTVGATAASTPFRIGIPLLLVRAIAPLAKRRMTAWAFAAISMAASL